MKHINLEGYAWQGEPTPTPVEIQLQVLGITKKVLETLKERNAKVLDVGCGKGAHLVKHLRNKGINTEGLDFRISEEDHEEFLIPYCMPKGIKMIDERIPRESQHYDLVISHCMDDFYDPIYVPNSKKAKEIAEFEKEMAKYPMTHVNRSDFAVLEATRMVKSKGKIMIYPGICAIKNMQTTLEAMGFSCKQQTLNKDLTNTLRKDWWDTYSWFEEPRKRGDYKKRTIMVKA